MFDITSTKLLILGVVALLVVGPKDLPVLLRTVGKYMGMLKRQAAEFRAQFDDAMRESELAELKKEVETIGRDAQSSLDQAQSTVSSEFNSLQRELDQTAGDVAKPLGSADPTPQNEAVAHAAAHEPAIAEDTSGAPHVHPPQAAPVDASPVDEAPKPRLEHANAEASEPGAGERPSMKTGT